MDAKMTESPTERYERIKGELADALANPRHPFFKAAQRALADAQRGVPEPEYVEPVPTAPLSLGSPRRGTTDRKARTTPAPPDPERLAIRRAFESGAYIEVAQRVAAYLGEPDNERTRSTVWRYLGGITPAVLDQLLAESRDASVREPARLLVWKLKRAAEHAPV